jgi:tetratricopeptide (TPR) repeat protein
MSQASDEIYEAQLADEPTPPRKTSWAGIVMILLVVSILVIPLLYVWAPQETARWFLASAVEQRLDGDLGGALESLDRAIEKFPDREELFLKRAEWRRHQGEYELALADVEHAVELAPHDAHVYLARCQIRQHLGRFEEAVEDMLKLLDFSDRQWGVDRAAVLNGLAYARALANQDLEEALKDVEEALRLHGDNGAMLDTRGFLHYRLGNLGEARMDMDRAVQEVEVVHEGLAAGLNGKRLGVIDKREEELSFQQHARSVAVIRYHRALVLDALNETEKAEQDRQRVVELGYEPSDELF